MTVSITHAEVPPGQAHFPSAAHWHSDLRTYNCASALPSEFVIGETWMSDQAAQRPLEEILNREHTLPSGLQLFVPQPGEIVEFDKRHPHRSPANPYSDPLTRTHVKIMVQGLRN